jgi:hypothetical protein
MRLRIISLRLNKLKLPLALRYWFSNQKNWQGTAINLIDLLLRRHFPAAASRKAPAASAFWRVGLFQSSIS